MAGKKNDRKIYLSAGKDIAIEEATFYHVKDMISYAQNKVVSKSVFKKITGSITVTSFDEGQGLVESASRFESFSQIIEGNAEMVINKVSYFLETGMCIVIPANTNNSIKPHGRFKMISTIIKSGYE